MVITESACLDKFVVDTDRLSASGEKTDRTNLWDKEMTAEGRMERTAETTQGSAG